MRMRLLVVSTLFVASFYPAHAQTTAQCRTVASALAEFAPVITKTQRILEDSFEGAIPQLKAATSGSRRVAVERFDESRRRLAEAMRDYASVTRTLHNEFEACS